MIDGSGLSPTVQAAGLIGVVLLEAIVLYGVYGALERAVGQRLIDRLAST